MKEQVYKQVHSMARLICLQSGIPEYIDGPMGKVINRDFEACFAKTMKKAKMEYDNGMLDQWFDEANRFIQNKGGVIGLFDKLGVISESIRKGETIMPEDKKTEISESELNKSTDKVAPKSRVWIAVVILLILVGVMIYFMTRKKAETA